MSLPKELTALHKLRVMGIMRLTKTSTYDKQQAIWAHIYATENALGTQYIVTIPDNRFYLILGATNKILPLPPHNRGGDGAFGYLFEMYGLPKTHPTTNAIYEQMRTTAQNEGVHVELRRFAAYKASSKTVYLSGYDGKMWRIDGENEPEKIPSGDDNVFFLDDDLGKPIEPEISDHGLLINTLASLNFEVGPAGITEEQQRKFMIVWMFAQAFPDLLPDKPVMLLEGVKGSGKCLGKGTLVMKADGSTISVENVKKGDRLMGPDGHARTVQSTTTGRGPLFRINPVKGEPWVCNDVHVLTLVKSQSHTNNVIDVSLDKWQLWGDAKKNLWKLFTVGIDDFETAKSTLTIDPYFLGAWFGDGTKYLDKRRAGNELACVQITKPDQEIEQLCRETARQWGLELSIGDPDIHSSYKCRRYAIVSREMNGSTHTNRLLTALRELVGSDLTVPSHYLRASKNERLAFLAGWLDTDGDLDSNCFSLTQKREDWARAVWWLARSVGLCSTISKRIGRCTKSDGSIFEGEYWRVSISGDTDAIPTRIPRKQATARQQIKKATRTGFSTTAIGVGDYYGFELDGDGRFLLGDFTVTHNSTAPLLIQLALTGVYKLMSITADQGKDFGVLLLRTPIAVLDNMDTFIDWMQDQIARYCTMGTFPKRRLFSDDEEILIKPNSFIAVTSRNPSTFRRDDVVDRLLIIRLKRYVNFKRAAQVIQEIEDNRARLLGEYLFHVNRIVKAIRDGLVHNEHVEKWRMASFASFVRIVGKVFEWSDEDVEDMLDAMQGERDVFEGEGDPLVEIMQEWIGYKPKKELPPIGREYALNELFKTYSNLAKNKEILFYKYPNRLAERLESSYIARHFRIETRQDVKTNTTYYRIWRITDPILGSVEDQRLELSGPSENNAKPTIRVVQLKKA